MRNFFLAAFAALFMSAPVFAQNIERELVLTGDAQCIAVSADGTVLVREIISEPSFAEYQYYLWQPGQNAMPITIPNGYEKMQLKGIGAGRRIGNLTAKDDDVRHLHAHVFDPDQGWFRLPTGAGTNSKIAVCNEDLTIAFGDINTKPTAWRLVNGSWTIEPLPEGPFSDAILAVSPSGHYVAGKTKTSLHDGSVYKPVLWRHEEGVWKRVVLPARYGGAATAVDNQGNVVCVATSDNWKYKSASVFTWSFQNGIREAPLPGNYYWCSHPYNIRDQVVLGICGFKCLGDPHQNPKATVWNDSVPSPLFPNGEVSIAVRLVGDRVYGHYYKDDDVKSRVFIARLPSAN